ncbi:MAG: FKBP-type peptidyl-prolyl cis-trans isomerase [Bdellovibrionaceae bacterium]|nr:FKBP-type peptidyl-prolyl cis-trans isomerase [Pseudobdellovibrionaceae bacterium]
MKQIAIIFALLFLTNLTFADSALEKEKTESQKFIDKEAKMAKTEQTLSGLLYRPVKEGNGAYPGATDTVTVEYKGTLRTGKVFDASPKSQPASFPLNGVIPCWTEALKKMRVGGTAIIICPSSIAYGDRGVGQDIVGGAALKFEVKLLNTKAF